MYFVTTKLSRIAAVITVAIVLYTAAAFGDDDDIVDITRQRPKRMRDATEQEAKQTVAETTTPEPVSEPEAEEDKPEFRGMNQVTVIRVAKPENTPVEDPPAETPKSMEGLGKSGNLFGGRIGLGTTLSIGGHVKMGLGEVNRLDIGISGGFGWGRDGYRTTAFETTIFYDWRFDVSDDGALKWYWGPGIALGYYGSSGRKWKDFPNSENPEAPIERRRVDDPESKFRVGVGAQLGLEVDLGFIDPDHSLYNTFKDASISFDIRPMFYAPSINKYPPMTVTLGLSFSYKF